MGMTAWVAMLVDILNGGHGNDTRGGGGNDVYQFNLGDGSDSIYEYVDGGNDKIVFGDSVGLDDVRVGIRYTNVSQYPQHPFITVGNNGDSISILGVENNLIESYEFSDGSVFSFEELVARQGGYDTFGDASNNYIYGSAGGYIDAGAGNDFIVLTGGTNYLVQAGTGNDTIVMNSPGLPDHGAVAS